MKKLILIIAFFLIPTSGLCVDYGELEIITNALQAPVLQEHILDIDNLSSDVVTTGTVTAVVVDTARIENSSGELSFNDTITGVKTLAELAAGGGGGTSGNNNEVLTDDGAGGIVSESNLIFDGTNLGIGVAPSAPLQVKGVGNNNIRLEETSGVEYFDLSITSLGNLEFLQDTGTVAMRIEDFDGQVYIAEEVIVGNDVNPSAQLHIEGDNLEELLRLRSNGSTVLTVVSFESDALHWANNLNGDGQGITIFTDWDWRFVNHDQDDLFSPAIILFSARDPDETNNQKGGFYHDRNNYNIFTGAQKGEGTLNDVACTADNTTNTFTDNGHGLLSAHKVLIGGDAVPTGIDSTQVYSLTNKTTNTFQVSLTQGGAAVPFSDDGTNVTWSLGSENGIKFLPRGTLAVEIDGDGGLVPKFETGDPCGSMKTGSIFYNGTSNYHCFCNGAGADIKMNDNITACF